MLEKFSTQHGIKTNFHYPSNLDVITPLQWKVIEENATEALTNVLKHAEATEVSLTITRLNRDQKRNRDDGHGRENLSR